MRNAAKPTFLGIGAQKCGSTWLHDILADHPQVCVGAKKELDFFSNCFDYGFQWYERQFLLDERHRAAGEVSPSYFHSPAAPRRVFEYNRDMRLILCLRNPVDRVVSNHKHEVRIGHLGGRDLSVEFGLENNPSYIEQGLYSTHLEKWLEYFPLERILVILLDDIAADAAGVARTVYRFLDIDTGHSPAALTMRPNEGHLNRFGWLETARARARAVARGAGLDRAWGLLGRLGGRRLYRSVNRAPAESMILPMTGATREMLAERFRPEIRRLEQIIGRSLAAWL